jgi:hypothetical protein
MQNLVSLICRILLKHAIKMDSVVKFSAVTNCACLPCTPGVNSADHQRVAIRCPSADYVWTLRYRTWAVVAVRSVALKSQIWH